MSPMGTALSDAYLANVLSYIREAWGNKARPLTAAAECGTVENVGRIETADDADYAGSFNAEARRI